MPKLWFTKEQVISKLVADGVNLKHLPVRISQAHNNIPKSEYKYVKGAGRNINVMYSERAYNLFLTIFGHN